MPLLAAIKRGVLSLLNASNVAAIILCGFDDPRDLATISCTPKVSNIALIGPPAIIPVPGLALRKITLPAPA